MKNGLSGLFVAALAIGFPATGPASAVDATVTTETSAVRVRTFADGLVSPWGLAFLPGGDMLVTERPGRLRSVSAGGDVSDPIAGVPEVDARGQGGLLDVALDPDFNENRLVYLSFAEPAPGGVNSTAVARGRLSEDGARLDGTAVIFSQQPKVKSTNHFGSRLVFDGDGHLFITTGERSDRAFRGQSQALDSHLGKVIRVFADGSVPPDNPFVGQEGVLPEIWSYGHRNVQAAAIHPETGQLWEIEHGPRGGDELNIVGPANNYGWPLVSHGIEYSGAPIGDGRPQMEGVTDAIYQWTPVIAPSGMIFYGGTAFPEWQGDLFVGGLRSTALVRLELDGQAVIAEERIIDDLDLRIRDVEEAPDGSLFLLVDDGDGEILRITPAETR
jgi:glucose/arabinose dehydrogenase